jgi:dihydrodipicolinate synthase/N-acetylneuraminate lyase
MVASAAMHMKPGTASHLLRKFIRERLDKGELINRLCEEFHKLVDRRKNAGSSILAQGARSLLQTSCLPLRNALDGTDDFDKNRTQQRELA